MAKTASYSLRLSQSVMREAKETASREGISLNQFIAGAFGEKLSVLRTEDLLKERAQRAHWRRVQAILDRVGTVPPQEGDELPK
jgi:HicB family